ncbi:hypothetical protein LJC19_00660 [Oxalobacter sp. OttesenSCG-928-P03]|nr:hypothetical protein [Oxalobacter sp. OttesenSCG-928-P03]
MKRFIKSGHVLGLLLFFAAGLAHAFDFGAVGDEPAVLYDTPSYNGVRLFIAPAHMPVELLLTYEGWTKIRDVSGDMAWIESKALGDKRFVIVREKLVQIHALPDTASPVVFQASKNVVLEKLMATEPDWVSVSHPDGQTGFVKTSEVWGM